MQLLTEANMCYELFVVKLNLEFFKFVKVSKLGGAECGNSIKFCAHYSHKKMALKECHHSASLLLLMGLMEFGTKLFY